MYTQALNTTESEDRHIEDADRAAQFQARIDAGDSRLPPAVIVPHQRPCP